MDRSAQEVADFIDIAATADQPLDPDRGIPSWESTRHDFGTIAEGDTVTHDFVLTNTGKKPFLITSSETDCGCTVPVYEDKDILPGKSEVVQVRFASNGRRGAIHKKISIYTNVRPHHHTLHLIGRVTATAD